MEKIEFAVQALPMIATIVCMITRGLDVFNVTSTLFLGIIILFNFSYISDIIKE